MKSKNGYLIFLSALLILGILGVIGGIFLNTDFVIDILLAKVSAIKGVSLETPGSNDLPNSHYWKLNLKYFASSITKLSFIFTILIAPFLFFKTNVLNILSTLNQKIVKTLTNKAFYTKLFFSFIIILLGYALLHRLSYFQVPGYNPDGYIKPAINFFENGFFKHIQGRSFIYPGFLLTILLIFKDFTYLSVIQHTLGVLGGLILFLSWMKFDIFIKSKSLKITHKVFGIIFLVSYLFNTFFIQIENMLMRESIFAFIFSLEVLFFSNFLINIYNNKKPYLWGSLTIFFSYFIYIYQPSWGFNIFVSLFAVIISYLTLYKHSTKVNYKNMIFCFLLLPLFTSFVLLYMPEKAMASVDMKSKTFGSGTFFYTHLNMIEKELKKDINDPSFYKYDKQILQSILDAKETNKVTEGNFSKLGYEFNKLFWGETRQNIDKYFKGDAGQIKGFYSYYFRKSIIKHPHIYIKKVFVELGDYYFNRKYPENKLINFQGNWTYSNNWEWIQERQTSEYLPMSRYANNVHKLANSSPEEQQTTFKFINYIYNILNFLYFPVLLAFIIIFIVSLIKFNTTPKSILILLFFNLFAYSLNFFSALTISASYIFINRYGNALFIILLTSEISTIFTLLCILKSKIKQIRQNNI